MGLDKPCAKCGEAIYYNCERPIDGLCGRCADRQLGRLRRPGKTKVVVREGGGASRGALLWFALGVLAGAAAMAIAQPYLG